MLEGASKVPPRSWHVCVAGPPAGCSRHIYRFLGIRELHLLGECFTRRVKTRGEGGARGAEIWGKASSPGWNASQITPDAVPSAPSSPPRRAALAPAVHPPPATLQAVEEEFCPKLAP